MESHYTFNEAPSNPKMADKTYLLKNEIAVCYKQKERRYYVRFSRVLIKDLFNQGFFYMSILIDKFTHEVTFFFSKEYDPDLGRFKVVQDPTELTYDDYRLSLKDMVELVAEPYGIKDDIKRLIITENKSHYPEDYYIVRVIDPVKSIEDNDE